MSAAALFVTLGVMFCGAALQPMIQGQYKRPHALVTLVVGGGFILLSVIWQLLPPVGLVVSVTNAANDFRVWFVALVVLPWLHITATSAFAEVRRNTEAVALRNDIHSIALVLERFVVPRRLTERQQRTVSSFLKSFDAHGVHIVVLEGDDEASEFASDLQRSLSLAGWTIKSTTSSPSVQNGLTLFQMQSAASPWAEANAKNPSPVMLLQMGFGLARVPLSGNGGGSGGEDRTEIQVGRRQKDLGWVTTIR